jgi:prepilin-type N-terminal cleavage/methylation domain-containing protein
MNERFRSRIKNLPEGFTLLELLISFTVVVILLMGAAQLTLLSVNIKRTSDCSVESAELASKKLEYLKSHLFKNNELAEKSLVEWLRSQRGNEMFRREWRIEDISENIKKIEMECYAESCPHKRVRLVLFCSRELGF